MTVLTPHRVPAGVPSGGQFAPGSTGESSVSLSREPVARRDYGGLTDDELLDCCRRSGRHWGRYYQVDPENLSSETMVKFLERVQRRNDERDDTGLATDPGAPDVQHARKYIDEVARSLALRQSTGLSSGRDLKALKEYLTRRDLALAQSGYRPLTAEQEDRIAEQVRTSMPPGRRPVPDFHRARSNRDAERATDFADPDTAPWAHTTGPLWPQPGRGTEFEQGSPGEQAEAALASGGRAGRLAARRMVWDAVAHPYDGPKVAHESLTEDGAAAARARVRGAGGPAQVARNAREYGLDDPRVGALMSPFGPDARVSDVHTVTRLLGDYPDRADDLWNAAVFAATRTRKAGAA